MHLIITRHGETIENIEGIIQGHLPGKLSQRGIEQAKRLAERLKDEKINFIYSSDLDRAANTAKEISRYQQNAPILYTEELREADYGEFTGRKESEVGWDNKNNVKYIKPRNGERDERLYDRAKSVLEKIYRKHTNENVLIVAHHRINRALICTITGRNSEYIAHMEDLGNTSISIFEIDENKGFKTKLFNCTKHLA